MHCFRHHSQLLRTTLFAANTKAVVSALPSNEPVTCPEAFKTTTVEVLGISFGLSFLIKICFFCIGKVNFNNWSFFGQLRSCWFAIFKNLYPVGIWFFGNYRKTDLPSVHRLIYFIKFRWWYQFGNILRSSFAKNKSHQLGTLWEKQPE